MKLPRWLTFWTGRPQRPQLGLVITEHGTLEDEYLSVEKAYAVSEDTREAWGLDAHNQVRSKEGYVQVVIERHVAPLPLWIPHAKKWTTALLSSVANESLNQAYLEIDIKQSEERVWWLFVIGAGCFAIAILMIIFQQFYLSGKINLPWK